MRAAAAALLRRCRGVPPPPPATSTMIPPPIHLHRPIVSDLRFQLPLNLQQPPARDTQKKKTFEELKDEESSLLKERTHLKKELAALQLTFVEQRSINDDLKRRKLDLPVESGTNSEANSVEPKEQNTNRNAASEATSSNVSRQVKLEETSEEPPSCSSHQRGGTSQVPIFVLPDLNIIPDEDCDPEGIVGMS